LQLTTVSEASAWTTELLGNEAGGRVLRRVSERGDAEVGESELDAQRTISRETSI